MEGGPVTPYWVAPMASEDDGYILDADGNRILIGLTLDETREFERLDELILSLSSSATDAKPKHNLQTVCDYVLYVRPPHCEDAELCQVLI
jgi:hypothetical protein